MAECLTPNIRSGPINCHNAATISAFEARVRSQLAFAARRQAAGGSDNGYDRACDDSLSNVGPHDEHKRSSVGFFKNMMGKKKAKSGEEEEDRHPQRRTLPASGRTTFPQFGTSARDPVPEYHVWQGIRIRRWTPDPTYKSRMRAGRKRIKGKLVKLELGTIMEVDAEE